MIASRILGAAFTCMLLFTVCYVAWGVIGVAVERMGGWANVSKVAVIGLFVGAFIGITVSLVKP